MNEQLLRMLDLRIVSYDEARNSQPGKKAKSLNLSMKETKNTLWFSIELDGEQVGVTGMIKVNDEDVRIKSSFILPEWRRMGFVSFSTVFQLRLAALAGHKRALGVARQESRIARLRIGWQQRPEKRIEEIWFDLSEPIIHDGTLSVVDAVLALREKYGTQAVS